MDLLSGIDTLISLQQEYNGVNIAVTPNGGNVRFIDLTREDKTEMSAWEVRTASIDVAVTAGTSVDFEAVDAAKLRLGEYVGFYDDTEFLGGGVITSIDGTTVTYTPTKGTEITTPADIDKIVLQKDPLILDGRTKPIHTSLFMHIIVQADADLEFSIEILQVGNCI